MEANCAKKGLVYIRKRLRTPRLSAKQAITTPEYAIMLLRLGFALNVYCA
jgi:hypothetical protein